MTSLLNLNGTPNLLELAEAGARASGPGNLSICGDEIQGLNSDPVELSPCADERTEISGLTDLSPCADERSGITSLTDLSVCGDDFNLQSPCADEISSDVRLKTDIEPVGTTVYGLPLYRFRYRTGPERFEGVMAQDVLQVMPDAVTTGEDGYYRVNYAQLGIRMTKA